MKNKKYRILAYILALVPLIIFSALYSKLPEQVPTNWGIDGTVTYSNKVNLWAMILMSPLFAVLFDVMPKIDPKKKNYNKFGKYYDAFCLFMMSFLLIMNGIIINESFYPGRISVSRVVIFLVAIMFIFLGNILPKTKTNFYFGIKTPWTISNPDVWNKAHRLGGRLMFGFGVIMLIINFFLSDQMIFGVMMVGIIIVTLIPTIMSYIWFKGSEKEES